MRFRVVNHCECSPHAGLELRGRRQRPRTAVVCGWVLGEGIPAGVRKARRREGTPAFRHYQSGVFVCMYERVVVMHFYKDFIF